MSIERRHALSPGEGRAVVASAGTPQVLGSAACQEVIIFAPSPAGVVWVGGASVRAASQTGYPLIAGREVRLEVDSLSQVYVDSTTAADAVSFLFIR